MRGCHGRWKRMGSICIIMLSRRLLWTRRGDCDLVLFDGCLAVEFSWPIARDILEISLSSYRAVFAI